MVVGLYNGGVVMASSMMLVQHCSMVVVLVVPLVLLQHSRICSTYVVV